MKALFDKLDNLRTIDGITHCWYMIDNNNHRNICLGIDYNIDSLSKIKDMRKDIRNIVGYSYTIEYELLTERFIIRK